MSEGDNNVRVAVRVRPLSSKELNNGDGSCIESKPGQLVITDPQSGEAHPFGFDIIFGDGSVQDEVFEAVGAPTLEKAFAGFNSCIFAYGQTGSGKTWSMQGSNEDRGIIPRMNASLFERIAEAKHASATASIQYLVTCSYFELYNEVIFDLLDPSDRKKRPKGGLDIKEHPLLGVYVKGVAEIVVDSAHKLQGLIDQGMRNRTVASTQMNADSSRSHSVFVVTIRQKDDEDESKNVFAKINLVDLAGSERVKSTGATGSVLKEGANINKSLSALGNVINALVEQAKGKRNTFVPYRNSKLTRVLQESLGGNSITCMLAACSPAESNFEETLSTLKYANRAKAIIVKAVKNEEASQVSKLNEEIKKLREQLAEGGGSGPQSDVTVDVSAMEERHMQQLKELEEAIRDQHWEEREKQSQRDEAERKRLEQEQKASMQQLEETKERSWLLLVEKNDLDLTLSHTKSLATKQGTTMNQKMVEWRASLKTINALEQRLADQNAIVQVYRSSLIKESAQLAASSSSTTTQHSPSKYPSVGGGVTCDKATLSMWRQTKDKVAATAKELEKWKELQEDLSSCIENFVESATTYLQEYKSSIGGGSTTTAEEKEEEEGGEQLKNVDTEQRDVLRALSLIASQIGDKASNSQQGVKQVRDANEEQLELLAVDLRGSLERYEKALVVETKMSAAENEGQEVTEDDGGGGGGDDDEIQQLLAQIQAALHPEEEAETTEAAAAAAAGEEQQEAEVVVVEEDEVQDKGDVVGTTLACGVTLATCNGDHIQTAAALGDIISWEQLVKKNPPSKFLLRPPIRFVFDLVKHIIAKMGEEISYGLFPSHLIETSWEAMGSSKESKMAFMQSLIDGISSYANVEPAASANSIVTGGEVEKTNMLFQQMAVCVKAHSQLPPDAKRIKSKMQKKQQQRRRKKQEQENGGGGGGLFRKIQTFVTVTMSAVEHLLRLDEARRVKRQDEAKRALEGLEALAVEKEGLTDQLTDLSQQLEKERSIKMQLEEERNITEAEKVLMQEVIDGHIEVESELKAELLRLQANFEKDKSLIEALRKQVDEQDELLAEQQATIEETNSKLAQCELEKDDVTSQAFVFEEERNAARANEEVLFEQLRECKQDLETLQESYVERSDRFNEVQDELTELRDAMAEKDLALERKEAALSAAMDFAQAAAHETAAVAASAAASAAAAAAAAKARLLEQEKEEKEEQEQLEAEILAANARREEEQEEAEREEEEENEKLLRATATAESASSAGRPPSIPPPTPPHSSLGIYDDNDEDAESTKALDALKERGGGGSRPMSSLDDDPYANERFDEHEPYNEDFENDEEP